MRKYEQKRENTDNELLKIINSFNKFIKGFRKYFGDINKVRSAEKILQTLRQTKLAAVYTAEFKIYTFKTK